MGWVWGVRWVRGADVDDEIPSWSVDAADLRPTACLEKETAGQSSDTGPHSDLTNKRAAGVTTS